MGSGCLAFQQFPDMFKVTVWKVRSLITFPALPSPALILAVDVTGVVQRSIFIQGEERRIEQHRVVVLHDNPLVLCLDPWLVLIG